ncbi:MAG: hypothetical protein KDJ36_03435 [Hyphomicrobiaceae bacterium]|nr:hypothetical protein [Hyphomicrobiaceae bacterium]
MLPLAALRRQMPDFARAAASSILMLAAMAASPLPVLAGTFDVKGVDVTKGESELSFGAAWQHGFPANSDFVRQSYEIAYGYGFTGRFKMGIKLGFEQPPGADLEANSAGVEGQYVLVKPDAGPIGLAWFTGYDFGLKSGESEVVTFGPLISFKPAKSLEVTLNPLFEKVWGPSEPGLNFVYAWQVKRELTDAFSVGVEGYGAIPDIGNWPSGDTQEHRLGPVIYWTTALGGGERTPMKLGLGGEPGKGGSSAKLELQLGVLFGLTDATADTTVRAKAGITW